VIIGAGFMMGLAPRAPALPVQDRTIGPWAARDVAGGRKLRCQ
jgi:hypothetical protein